MGQTPSEMPRVNANIDRDPVSPIGGRGLITVPLMSLQRRGLCDGSET